MHPCVILEILLLYSCVLGDICEGQSTIFQPSPKWICKVGCRQPLLHFSHELCFSTEPCRFTPDLAVLPDCCSKLFKGKPCCTIHRSISNQEPEYMHEHMFLKLSWVTWKQVLFLVFTGGELLYVYLST